jgi:alcohol dehydrogenase YqhD (iron-dependent ADH family)
VIKVEKNLSLKITDIGNQVQTLNDKLLIPFSANNINMEAFFQHVAETLKQRDKDVKEMSQR